MTGHPSALQWIGGMDAALRAFYGVLHRPPPTLFQFLVWEILSEHAVPARRDLAWAALRRIPALTPDSLARAPAPALGEAIALTGLPREETSDRLKATAETFRRHRDDLDLDRHRDAGLRTLWRRLAALDHLDPHARRRALLFALDVPVLPVDEEISRVIQRLSRVSLLVPGSTRARAVARRWLAAELPHDLEAYRDAVVYLRHHAQHTCLAVGPHCHVCPLTSHCATGQSREGALTGDRRP
jgi:endonuclease III